VQHLTSSQFRIFVASFRALSELRVQRYGVFLNLPNFFETFFEKKAKKTWNKSFLSNICVEKATILGFMSRKTK
jgi:hypothetical protein